MSTRGETAELLAAQYLSNQGLKLLKRNYRCRHGEIDLILQDGDTLVFAEVRLRSHNHYGGAAASINAAKQKRLIRTAQHYLATLRSATPRPVVSMHYYFTISITVGQNGSEMPLPPEFG